MDLQPRAEKSGSALVVRKYGGATLSDAARIGLVADQLLAHHRSGEKQVVVVSAMGDSTNELLKLASSVSKSPSPREIDMLISVGERISMSLLAMALIDRGVPAVSLTGSQAGILTDSQFSNAKIKEVRPGRVLSLLQEGKLVILAGFQGVSANEREITTLGRGGSDTTAIALAAALGADHCEILKEFGAIATADPKAFATATSIARMSYDLLTGSTFWGTKAIHDRAARLAKKFQVPIWVGPAGSSAQKEMKGTWIMNGSFQTNTGGSISEEPFAFVLSRLGPVYRVGYVCRNSVPTLAVSSFLVLAASDTCKYIYTENSLDRQRMLSLFAPESVDEFVALTLSWQGTADETKVGTVVDQIVEFLKSAGATLENQSCAVVWAHFRGPSSLTFMIPAFCADGAGHILHGGFLAQP